MGGLFEQQVFNWNPEINHSCCMATFKQEVENMTFRAKYNQQTDKIIFSPDRPTPLIYLEFADG